MKAKSWILMAALSVCASMSAADLSVVSTEKLDVKGYYPVLSPDGSKVLFTTSDHDGLKSLDLSSSEVTLIDDSQGTGFDPAFSADGKSVIYRSIVKVDGLIRRDVKSYDLATGEKVQLLEPSRGNVDIRQFVGKTFAYGAARTQAIEVSLDGKKQTINPIESGYRYLWASVSPSNSKLVFTEVYSGLFVSELDGTKAKFLASRAEFPCWAGDSYVVALYTEDDGYVVTKSKVIAIDIESGKVIDLTDGSSIVNGVTATKDKVVYTTEGGEMFIMNIKITE